MKENQTNAAEATLPPATCSACLAGSVYFPLFEHMSKEHGLTLLDSELAEIIRIASQFGEDAEVDGGSMPDNHIYILLRRSPKGLCCGKTVKVFMPQPNTPDEGRG